MGPTLYSWWVNSQRLSLAADDEAAIVSDRYAVDAVCRATGRLRYLEILYAMHLVALIYFHPVRRSYPHLTVSDLLRLPMSVEAHNALTRTMCRSLTGLGISYQPDKFPFRMSQKHREGKQPHDLFNLPRKHFKNISETARKTLARLVGSVKNQTRLEIFFETTAALVLASDQSAPNKALFYEFAITMHAALKQLKNAAFKSVDRVVQDATLTRSTDSFRFHFTDGTSRNHRADAPRETLDVEVRKLVTTFKWRFALREIDRLGREVAHLHAPPPSHSSISQVPPAPPHNSQQFQLTAPSQIPPGTFVPTMECPPNSQQSQIPPGSFAPAMQFPYNSHQSQFMAPGQIGPTMQVPYNSQQSQFAAPSQLAPGTLAPSQIPVVLQIPHDLQQSPFAVPSQIAPGTLAPSEIPPTSAFAAHFAHAEVQPARPPTAPISVADNPPAVVSGNDYSVAATATADQSTDGKVRGRGALPDTRPCSPSSPSRGTVRVSSFTRQSPHAQRPLFDAADLLH